MNQKKLFGAYAVIAPLMAIFTALLYLLSFIFSFDEELNYFTLSPLVIIARSVLGLSLCLVFIWPILFGKQYISKLDTSLRDPGTAEAVNLVLPAVGFLICAFTSFRSDIALIFQVILRIGAIAAALLFAFRFYGAMRKKDVAVECVSFGLIALFWCLEVIYHTYVDVYITLNSPLKLLPQFALFSVMLMIIAELRSIGKIKKSGGWFFAISLCSAICGAAGLPLLVFYIRHGDFRSIYFGMAAVATLCGMYSLSRLMGVFSRNNESRNEKVPEISAPEEAVPSEETVGNASTEIPEESRDEVASETSEPEDVVPSDKTAEDANNEIPEQPESGPDDRGDAS